MRLKANPSLRLNLRLLWLTSWIFGMFYLLERLSPALCAPQPNSYNLAYPVYWLIRLKSLRQAHPPAKICIKWICFERKESGFNDRVYINWSSIEVPLKLNQNSIGHYWSLWLFGLCYSLSTCITVHLWKCLFDRDPPNPPHKLLRLYCCSNIANMVECWSVHPDPKLGISSFCTSPAPHWNRSLELLSPLRPLANGTKWWFCQPHQDL